MTSFHMDEQQYYREEVAAIEELYFGGKPKEVILQKLIRSAEAYTTPEYRSHFLLMISTVLLDLHQIQAAYEICLNTEKAFPGTVFSKAAADRAKTLFVKGGGQLRPVPPFCLTVQVEPTNHCNLSCIMCARDKKRKMGYMTFDTFQRVADESLSAGAVAVRLYHMGEPLLHSRLCDFVKYYKESVHDHGFNPPCMPRVIGIQTNGTLLSEGMIAQLLESGVDEISFSIDGRTPEEFERIRKGASFSTVLNNLCTTAKLKSLHHSGTRICVSILDMSLTEEDRIRLKTLYQANGAELVAFMPCSHFHGREVINRHGDIVPAMDHDNSIHSEAETSDADNVNSSGMGDIDRMVVLWNGDIKPSCGESSPETVIGNVHTTTLVEAYRTKWGLPPSGSTER